MNIDLEMGLIKNNKENEISVYLDIIQLKNNNRKEILINKFIEKFPKVKLHTIIKVHKYYNENYDIEEQKL